MMHASYDHVKTSDKSLNRDHDHKERKVNEETTSHSFIGSSGYLHQSRNEEYSDSDCTDGWPDLALHPPPHHSFCFYDVFTF